jgi:hypothetical protein
MTLGNCAELILNQMQVFDEEVAPARSFRQKFADFAERQPVDASPSHSGALLVSVSHRSPCVAFGSPDSGLDPRPQERVRHEL